jgi:aflatoxin B1 aldehyde reductase
MLSGKYVQLDEDRDGETGGRFGKASPISGASYSARYWHPWVFDAVQVVREACLAAELPMAAASLRWLVHHSVLSPEHHDGVIIGASSLACVVHSC